MVTVLTEQLTPGTIIVYKLLPQHRPTHPDKEWRGRVLSHGSDTRW